MKPAPIPAAAKRRLTYRQYVRILYGLLALSVLACGYLIYTVMP